MVTEHDDELRAALLAHDGALYGVVLLGGDTVSTPGPLTASLTAMGWVPEGRMVRRAGAKPGDVVAALIDGQSTLKTLVKERGKVWLRAENPKYPNLLPLGDLMIQGVLRMVGLRLAGDELGGEPG